MTARKAAEPEVSEVVDDPETEPAPTPAPAAAPSPAPDAPTSPKDPAPEPAAAVPQAPAPPLGEQIATALKVIHDEDAHRKEHEKLAAEAVPEPEPPKSFWDKLRWGG